MSWVKLDDAFFTDQRAIKAGLDGRGLFLASLCYIARNKDDGHIDAEAVPVIAALAAVDPAVASKLVRLGLWEVEDGGYYVPHYLDYNPSREQLDKERQASAERQRRSRSRRESRVTDDVSNGVSSGAPSSPVPYTDPLRGSTFTKEARPQGVETQGRSEAKVHQAVERLKVAVG